MTIQMLYARSKVLRWTVALLFAGVFLILVLLATVATARILQLALDDPLQRGLALLAHLALFLPLWMLMCLFFLAPLFRLTGVLRYDSPYLVVSRRRPGHVELHGATPFDYLLLFHWRDRGRRARRCILLWYVEGLLALAREIEAGLLPRDVTICATSYFFSASTAKKYGFTVAESRRFICGGLLTYPTQLLTYSFSQAAWAFPPVSRAKKATLDGAGLCAQISRLEHLRERLCAAQAARGAAGSVGKPVIHGLIPPGGE